MAGEIFNGKNAHTNGVLYSRCVMYVVNKFFICLHSNNKYSCVNCAVAIYHTKILFNMRNFFSLFSPRK